MKESKSIRTIFDNYDGYSYEDAKAYCIERHLDEEPDDTEWEPEDSEIYQEIEDCNNLIWEDTSRELERFFNDGSTYILTGTAGTWRGRLAGGCVINGYNDLTKAWANCDYVKIYDDLGKFFIEASHHDGTNCWEVKKLTKRGESYLGRHQYDDDRELHEKLFSKGYSVNLHYAKKVFG